LKGRELILGIDFGFCCIGCVGAEFHGMKRLWGLGFLSIVFRVDRLRPREAWLVIELVMMGV
jgi:hypothetical protein